MFTRRLQNKESLLWEDPRVPWVLRGDMCLEAGIRHLRIPMVLRLTVCLTRTLLPNDGEGSNGLADLLEMTIVSADGQHRVLNQYSHPDYFWAVRGGGGSAWGV